jgi:hypothetical protein
MHSVHAVSRGASIPLARAWKWILAVGVAGYPPWCLEPCCCITAGVANDTLVYAFISISFAALILSLVAA